MQLVSTNRPAPEILKRGIRHLLAGGAGTLLYMVLVAAFVELVRLQPVTSVVLAFVVFEVYTYAVNRAWVYVPKQGHDYAVPRFLIVTAVSLGLNTGIMYVIVELLGMWYFWGLVATALVVPPTNFLLNYFWAFK